MADAQERTHPATERRRREAWKEGDIAYSRKLSLLLHHLLFTLFFAVLVQAAALALTSFARRVFSLQAPLDAAALFEAANVFIRVSWPFWVVGLAGALLAGIAQTGLVPNFLRLRPKFDLSPARGLQKIWRLQTLVDALVALPLALFLVMGSLLLLWMVRNDVLSLQLAPGMSKRAASLFRTLLWVQFAAILVLSAIDVGIVLWRHARKLRMTRQEVQEEMRQQEGDPHVRSQRRSFFERLLAMPPEHRLISQAKVVIVNPEHVAVAIGTDETREPCVLARGQGETARRFKHLARRAGIPVVQDPRLARALYALDEEAPIPSELLEAIAIIFVALGLD